MVKVVVTGAHSGIGQDLIKSVCEKGVEVLALITPWAKQDGLYQKDGSVIYIPCDLQKTVPADIVDQCKDAEILVHLAWARPKDVSKATSDNLDLYQNLTTALPDDIKTVFMSSVCATDVNPSYYGQAKFALAQKMDRSRTVEIIAGLVMSEPAMGPYLALQNFVCKLHGAFKFLPSPMAVVADADQVMQALEKSVLDFDNCPRLVAAYRPEAVRLNDLIVDILKVKKVSGLPIPVPNGLTVAMLYLVRKLVPSMSIADRLITLLTVSPEAVEKRVVLENKDGA
ncbi:hypothetical protein RYZ26_14770 [Terasakiella sp. A23]|nr:hypothetical protein [Terasakiella sp. A23]